MIYIRVMQFKSKNLYLLYGLAIESEFPIYGLMPASDVFTPDVVVELGKVPRGLRSPRQRVSWIEYARGVCLFDIPDVARFLIQDGMRIRIQIAAQDESSSLLQAYLVGTAFAAILHQRGLLPLHVGSVESPLGTVAFNGESGAGKSTLSCSLARNRGWEIRADDVAVVEIKGEFMKLLSGPARARLCPDAASLLSLTEKDYISKHGSGGKVVVDFERIASGVSPAENLVESEWKFLICLGFHEKAEPEFELLEGIDKFKAVREAIYRPFLAEWFQDPSELFAMLADISRRLTVIRFCRMRSLERFDLNSRALVQFLQDLE